MRSNPQHERSIVAGQTAGDTAAPISAGGKDAGRPHPDGAAGELRRRLMRLARRIRIETALCAWVLAMAAVGIVASLLALGAAAKVLDERGWLPGARVVLVMLTWVAGMSAWFNILRQAEVVFRVGIELSLVGATLVGVGSIGWGGSWHVGASLAGLAGAFALWHLYRTDSAMAAWLIDEQAGLEGRLVTAAELLAVGGQDAMGQLVCGQALAGLDRAKPVHSWPGRRALAAAAGVWVVWGLLGLVVWTAGPGAGGPGMGAGQSPASAYDVLAQMSDSQRAAVAGRLREAMALGALRVRPAEARRAAVAVELNQPGQLQAVLDALDRAGRRDLMGMVQQAGVSPQQHGARQQPPQGSALGLPAAATTARLEATRQADSRAMAMQSTAGPPAAAGREGLPVEPSTPGAVSARRPVETAAADARATGRQEGRAGTAGQAGGAGIAPVEQPRTQPAASRPPSATGDQDRNLPARYRQAIRRYFQAR